MSPRFGLDSSPLPASAGARRPTGTIGSWARSPPKETITRPAGVDHLGGGAAASQRGGADLLEPADALVGIVLPDRGRAGANLAVDRRAQIRAELQYQERAERHQDREQEQRVPRGQPRADRQLHASTGNLTGSPARTRPRARSGSAAGVTGVRACGADTRCRRRRRWASRRSPQPRPAPAAALREINSPGRRSMNASRSYSRGVSSPAWPGPGDHARKRVGTQVADLDRRRPFGGPTTNQSAQARKQLTEVERLDQVVVGAAVEPANPVRDLPERGEHQHRHPSIPLPQSPAHRVAVDPGQQHVEDHRVVFARRRLGEGLIAGVGEIDGVALRSRPRATVPANFTSSSTSSTRSCAGGPDGVRCKFVCISGFRSGILRSALREKDHIRTSGGRCQTVALQLRFAWIAPPGQKKQGGWHGEVGPRRVAAVPDASGRSRRGRDRARRSSRFARSTPTWFRNSPRDRC